MLLTKQKLGGLCLKTTDSPLAHRLLGRLRALLALRAGLESVDDQPEVAEDVRERLSNIGSGDEEEIALTSQAVETEDHAAAGGVLVDTVAAGQSSSYARKPADEVVPHSQTSLRGVWGHRNRNARRLPPASHSIRCGGWALSFLSSSS